MFSQHCVFEHFLCVFKEILCFLLWIWYCSETLNRRQSLQTTPTVPQRIGMGLDTPITLSSTVAGTNICQMGKGAYDIPRWGFFSKMYEISVKTARFFVTILPSIGAFSTLGWFSMLLAPFWRLYASGSIKGAFNWHQTPSLWKAPFIYRDVRFQHHFDAKTMKNHDFPQLQRRL